MAPCSSTSARDGVWGDDPFQSLPGSEGLASAPRSPSRTARSSSARPSSSTRTRGSTTTHEAGAAHVYELAEGYWNEFGEALRDPDPGHGNRFGAAVAIDGDTIAVGSPGESDGFAGRVVVFRDPARTPPHRRSTGIRPATCSADRWRWTAASSRPAVSTLSSRATSTSTRIRPSRQRRRRPRTSRPRPPQFHADRLVQRLRAR